MASLLTVFVFKAFLDGKAIGRMGVLQCPSLCSVILALISPHIGYFSVVQGILMWREFMVKLTARQMEKLRRGSSKLVWCPMQ